MAFNRKKYMKEYNPKYYLENKKKIIENVRNWGEKNLDKRKEYVRKANNSEKAKIRKERWVNNNMTKNREIKKQCQKKYARKNIEIIKAQRMAKKIQKKSNCEICGSTNNLQRHHWRYDKPLRVNTLCGICHQIQHIKHFDSSIYRRALL